MILDDVYTISEAAELWEISESGLRNAINRFGKFDKQLKNKTVKKSGNTWLISRQAMIEVFGELEEIDVEKLLNNININNVAVAFCDYIVEKVKETKSNKAEYFECNLFDDLEEYLFIEINMINNQDIHKLQFENQLLFRKIYSEILIKIIQMLKVRYGQDQVYCDEIKTKEVLINGEIHHITNDIIIVLDYSLLNRDDKLTIWETIDQGNAKTVSKNYSSLSNRGLADLDEWL